MEAISIGDAKDYLKVITKQHLPLMLWGPPGIGKSAIVHQIALENKWEMKDLRLSLLNPIDLRGLPFVDKDKQKARWLKPDFLPEKGTGILFLDEINKAPLSVMAAAYQLILDRKIGEYVLPKNWRIIAAGNREIDRANVNVMPSPLANRFIHLEVRADYKAWRKWAEKNKIDERITGFLDFKTDLLSQLPKDGVKAYATPRSWASVSEVLSLYKDADDARALVQGTIGEGITSEFYSWLPGFANLPNVSDILKGKSKVVPKKPDILDALVKSLVSNLTDENLTTFLDYTFLLPKEFSVVAIKLAVAGGWENPVQELARWEEWTEKHDDIL